MSFDDPACRALADYKRSAERGMGPGQMAMALPFERLGELHRNSMAWVPFGPMLPINALITGSWFLAREVELSCMRAVLVTLTVTKRPSVTVYLPACKNDLTAQGVARTQFRIACGGPGQPALSALFTRTSKVFAGSFPGR